MRHKIFKGNCGERLKELASDSVDLIATDPPYQLSSTRVYQLKENVEQNTAYGAAIRGFMGETWDVLPSIEILKECLRVLKPGAFSFWLMTPRQDSYCEFVVRLRQAGFVVSFSPMAWVYASGFPKASGIAKQVMKKVGDKGEVVGKPTSPEAKALDGSYSGFQPKPAFEMIVVAMKPLSEKTYVAQALKNRKGITWMDDVRIPYASDADLKARKIGFDKQDIETNLIHSNQQKGGYGYKEVNLEIDNRGRFPANLLVSDDALNDGEERNQGHWAKSKVTGFGEFGGWSAEYFGVGEKDCVDSLSRYFDLDSWWGERVKKLPPEVQKIFPFLYRPKAGKSEKNDGLDGFEERTGAELTGRKEAGVREHGGERPEAFHEVGFLDWLHPCEGVKDAASATFVRKNTHPTCKPIQLMCYLITLGSRKGDVVLDPFMGSGTTLIAAHILNRNSIGCEMEEDYVRIAAARLGKAVKQAGLFETHEVEVE